MWLLHALLARLSLLCEHDNTGAWSKHMTWRDHIVVDPAICHGKPCIKGTRVLVSVVLDNIAAGETPGQIATTYRLAKEDVQAALQYAAELARERIVPLETGAA